MTNRSSAPALSEPSTGSTPISRKQRIIQAARMIFSAYRRDDFADPDTFVLQLGIVLERYPDDVIGELSHPLTGIQRRLKKPPSIADIVEGCEDILDRRPEPPKPLEIEPPVDPVMQARIEHLFGQLSSKLHADADEARGLTIRAMEEEKGLSVRERLERQRKRQMV